MKDNLNNDMFYVVYYPRSAGRFFVINYELATREFGSHVHEVDFLSGTKLLSIIRTPIEAIASRVIAGKILNGHDEDQVLQNINESARDYVYLNNKILDSGIPIFKFEDVVNRFQDVAKVVSKMFSHEIVESNPVVETVSNDGYIKTSTTDEDYSRMLDLVANHEDISECLKIYNKLYRESIEI
jgi:hypothetical protein